MVTNNTFKLYQVREQLKQSKQLYVEEEQILEEFNKVKECLSTNHMDEDEFEAARETCLVLGGKLGAIRRKQDRCYGDTKDLETVIDKEIVACKFEEKELRDMDLAEVRGRTPARQLSPTPLDRHRSQSRERSVSRDYKLPGAKLSQVVSGRQTPDPCAYFSRPSSSLSVYGGRGGRGEDEVDPFRAAMEEKQKEDFPEPLVLRSATGDLLIPDSECPHDLAFEERPCSAMSDMSLDAGPMTRPGSRMEANGDVVSKQNSVAPVQPMNKAEPKPSIQEKKVILQKEETKKQTKKVEPPPPIQEPTKPEETETKINKTVTVTAKETQPSKEVSKPTEGVPEKSQINTSAKKLENGVKNEVSKSNESQPIKKEITSSTETKEIKKEVIGNDNEALTKDKSVKFVSPPKDSTNKVTKKEEEKTITSDPAPSKPVTKETVAKKEPVQKEPIAKKEPVKKEPVAKKEPVKKT